MVTQIFVNLAVADLPRSKAFWQKLGFAFDPKFTNDEGACLVLGERIYAMLLVERFFRTFTSKTLVDATRSVEGLYALEVESRARVDELVRLAVAAGGKAHRDPQDHGFMYAHGFEDLDGHIWELLAMIPGAEPKA